MAKVNIQNEIGQHLEGDADNTREKMYFKMDQFSVKSNLLHQNAPTSRTLTEIRNLPSLRLTLKQFQNVHGYS